MPIYTTEELIQYLYRETSADETRAIEQAIHSDWSVREKFEALKESMEQLETLTVSPRAQSVNAILNYAKRTTPVEQS